MRLSRRRSVTTARVLERCAGCGAERGRAFAAGDVLFAESPGCPSCGGTLVTERIYGETEEL